MDMVHLTFVVCVVSLFAGSSSFRSERHKRNLMKHFMHIYWDPGRLIGYYDAVETTKEIAKDWRRKIPAAILMPFLGEKRVINHFLGPVVGYKNYAPIRRKSYDYPYNAARRKPLVPKTATKDVPSVERGLLLGNVRVVVLPNEQFNRMPLPDTVHDNSRPPQILLGPLSGQSGLFSMNLGNNKHLSHAHNHNWVPVYTIVQNEDAADGSGESLAMKSSTASKRLVGYKIPQVPKRGNLNLRKNVHNRPVSTRITDDGYSVKDLPCAENMHASPSNVYEQPSNLVKISNMIKILKQKSHDTFAEESKNNREQEVLVLRNIPHTGPAHARRGSLFHGKDESISLNEETNKSTKSKIFHPIVLVVPASSNSGEYYMDDGDELHDEQSFSVAQKPPDLDQQQHVKRPAAKKVMVFVVKKPMT